MPQTQTVNRAGSRSWYRLILVAGVISCLSVIGVYHLPSTINSTTAKTQAVDDPASFIFTSSNDTASSKAATLNSTTAKTQAVDDPASFIFTSSNDTASSKAATLTTPSSLSSSLMDNTWSGGASGTVFSFGMKDVPATNMDSGFFNGVNSTVTRLSSNVRFPDITTGVSLFQDILVSFSPTNEPFTVGNVTVVNGTTSLDTNLTGILLDSVIQSPTAPSGENFIAASSEGYATVTVQSQVEDGSYTSVPEPTSLALMSLGLFGLGFNRRKRLQ